jgi:hypothetical protein
MLSVIMLFAVFFTVMLSVIMLSVVGADCHRARQMNKPSVKEHF